MLASDPHDSDFTFRQLVERIADRVRPVCANMPEAEFRQLVEQMARIEQKYIHYPNEIPGKLRSPGTGASEPSRDESE